MKVEIQAGAKFETLTPGEVQTMFAGWMAELARGPRFRRFSAQTTKGAGTWAIDGQTTADPLGPAEGFLWSVMFVAFAGSGFTAGTDAVSVFIGDDAPSRIVASGITRRQAFNKGEVVLLGGEALSLTGAATGAGDQVFVSGSAIEVPVQYAQMLT